MNVENTSLERFGNVVAIWLRVEGGWRCSCRNSCVQGGWTNYSFGWGMGSTRVQMPWYILSGSRHLCTITNLDVILMNAHVMWGIYHVMLGNMNRMGSDQRQLLMTLWNAASLLNIDVLIAMSIVDSDTNEDDACKRVLIWKRRETKPPMRQQFWVIHGRWSMRGSWWLDKSLEQ